VVATCRLFDTTGLGELRLASGRELRPALAPSAEIDRCLRRCLGTGADTVQSTVSDVGDAGIQVVGLEADEGVDLTEAAEGASVIRFVNQALIEAIEPRATDVHFEPFEGELRVRYRVDGVLQQATIPPQVRRFQAAIVSRLKILSGLDIAEKRVPQDGRTKIKVTGREIDVRVSVIPMLHGEAIVLRLLDRSAALLGLRELGMSEEDLVTFERVVAQRLVRLICRECREPVPEDELARAREEFGEDLPPTLWHGRGCRACQGSGYRGRTGIFELMPMTDAVRTLVLQRASSRAVRDAAAPDGMKSLGEDGWRLVAEGRTTADELLRVTKDEQANGLHTRRRQGEG